MATIRRPRTKEIPGYRVQPRLPIGLACLGGVCVEADFTEYTHLGTCVEALVKLGLIDSAYTLVLTLEQAVEADIIERA